MAQATHATQITHARHGAQGTSCGQCGAALAASSQFCTRCGAPRLRRTELPRSRATGGIRLARMPQVAAAASVDVVLGAVLIAGAVLLGISAHDINLWIVYSAVVALAVAAHVYVLLYTGQSLGARLAGVRLVSSVTWSAPGARLKSLQFADLREGEDPLAPQLPPVEVTLGERTVAAGHDVVAPQRKGWVLIIDEERRVPLTGSFVVGRNPAVDPGETAVAVPDLGRLLSKGHLRFDIDPDGSVFVTDLGSTNGSQIDDDALVPYERAAVTVDARILAGDHVFRVENRAHTREGARR